MRALLRRAPVVATALLCVASVSAGARPARLARSVCRVPSPTERLDEPLITAGPTELISGFYLDGGPAAVCRRREPQPGAGAVEVIDPASGAVVARQTSSAGRLVEIPLQPGSYTIVGTFIDATVNGRHPTRSLSVVIPSGHRVRQDFTLSIR